MKSLLLCTKQLYLPDPCRIYFHYLEWLLNVKVFYHIISHVLKYVQVHLPHISYIRYLLAFYVNKYTHILRSVEPISTHATEHTQHETEWTSYFLTKEGITTIIVNNHQPHRIPQSYATATPPPLLTTNSPPHTRAELLTHVTRPLYFQRTHDIYHANPPQCMKHYGERNRKICAIHITIFIL